MCRCGDTAAVSRSAADEVGRDVVDLDRGEPQAFEALDGAGLAHETCERVTGGGVAEAAEVDTREDDLAVTLAHPALDLA